MRKFQIIDNIIGYITKKDPSLLPAGTLINGSKNVLINDYGRVQTRGGYSLFGASNSNTDPIESSFDWQTSTDKDLNIRSYDDELEVYDSNIGSWKRVKDGWSAVDFIFATWWDNTEKIDLLLFVNGDSSTYEWSGGVAEVDSVTSNTITKTGTDTWGEARFYTARDKTILINGTEYTYTGGEGTTTLTGVTPDPTSSVSSGDIATQKVVTNLNNPTSGFNNDIIGVLNNQVYYGSRNSRLVYISADDNFADPTFSSPRAPGEGGLITLDEPAKAFASQNQKMFISAGKSDWYRVNYSQLEINAALAETVNVKKLKTGSNQGAKSQNLLTNVGNTIAFISNEPALRLFGDMENLEEPQLQTLSNEIKPDFDEEDFSNGNIAYHRNRIYISAPTNDKVYINEVQDKIEGQQVRFWHPPQILPVRMFSVIDGDIYGHSGRVPETYKLFDGLNDNDRSYNAKAVFSYMTFGDVVNLKMFDEIFITGFIRSNTVLKITTKYDYGGFTQKIENEIDGSDDNILFENTDANSLATQSLATSPLADNQEAGTGNPKFMQIIEIARADFHEIALEFETDAKDNEWEILAFALNVSSSVNQPINIKK